MLALSPCCFKAQILGRWGPPIGCLRDALTAKPQHLSGSLFFNLKLFVFCSKHVCHLKSLDFIINLSRSLNTLETARFFCSRNKMVLFHFYCFLVQVLGFSQSPSSCLLDRHLNR